MLPYLPEREAKPRQIGLTMVMDKGLSLREAEQFCESSADFTDIVKLGFGTAVITRNLKEKLAVYRKNNIRVYFGGTLFELFLIRDMFDSYRKLIDEYKLDIIEISDGSMNIQHDKKLEYIRTLSSQVTVVSEVGYKVSGVTIPMEKWAELMSAELKAGAWKVIAEARESGNTGIYNADGSANADLVCSILGTVQQNDILWEAPNKSQQAYFIKLLGAGVNLGNIAPYEALSLETLRLGLRGDTFFDFLPENLLSYKLK